MALGKRSSTYSRPTCDLFADRYLELPPDEAVAAALSSRWHSESAQLEPQESIGFAWNHILLSTGPAGLTPIPGAYASVCR